MGKATDNRRIVIVSLDATGKRDMEYMLSLPNFRKIVDNGVFCDNVESVYPSLTYPAHTSIVTGLTPNHHRIVANTKFQPERNNPDWMYKKNLILGKSIIDVAKEKGMKVCTLLWPVTGGGKIDYNLPEILVTRKWQNQITACLANGSIKYMLELQKRFSNIRHGIEQPALDDFIMASSEYTIKKYDPDLLMIHLTDVDTNRHIHGADNEYIKEALKRHDERLGNLLTWLSKTRSMEDTTFIVLGDHCQRDAHTIVYLNKYFLDKGYITVKGDKIVDYKAIAKTCDGSTYIYINDKWAMNEPFLMELTDSLNELKNTESLGIQEIYTSEEAALMGADENCFVMIEGKPGFYFLNEFEVLTEPVLETKNHKMLAIHGCLPTGEDLKTFFAAIGKGIKKGVKIDSMRLWDEGPTIAKLMGGNLPKADGRVMDEILE